MYVRNYAKFTYYPIRASEHAAQHTHLPAACPVPRMDKASAMAATADAPGFPFPWPSPRFAGLPTLIRTSSYQEQRPPPQTTATVAPQNRSILSNCPPRRIQYIRRCPAARIHEGKWGQMAQAGSSKREGEKKERLVYSNVLEVPVRVASKNPNTLMYTARGLC